MKQEVIPIKIFKYIFLALLISTSTNTLAQNSANSFIEFSKSHRSETLGDIHNLSLYSSLSSDNHPNSYAGIQLMTFEKNIIGEEDALIKFFVGKDMGLTFSPFYEIGTDFNGFLKILIDIIIDNDNDNDTKACTEDQKCATDLFFRVGFKVKLGKNLVLRVFHENINFGDFHTNLSGEHSYTGSSIGLIF